MHKSLSWIAFQFFLKKKQKLLIHFTCNKYLLCPYYVPVTALVMAELFLIY